MDVSQPLKRAQLHNQSLVAVQSDEDMDWVSKFVNVFDRCHRLNLLAIPLTGEVMDRNPSTRAINNQ